MGIFDTSALWEGIAKTNTDLDKLRSALMGTDKELEIVDLKLKKDSKDINTLETGLKLLESKFTAFEKEFRDFKQVVTEQLDKLATDNINKDRTIQSLNNRINSLETKNNKVKEIL